MRGRSDEPLAWLEGPKAIRDSLARGQVEELILLDGGADTDTLARDAEHRSTPIQWVDRATWQQLGRAVTPQGAGALVRDPAVSVDDLLARQGRLLWLDGVQDPGNVGAIVRIAAAFGTAGLLVGAGSADPMGAKALRASTGLALQVPFARVPQDAAASCLERLGRPLWILDGSGDPLDQVAPAPEAVVLGLGAEGPGVGPLLREHAARTVSIAIHPLVESLNVAVAAGIAVHGLMRSGTRA